MLPRRIFLNGIDYFQLLIDHHSKQKGGPGHEARLAVYVKGVLDESKIRNALLNNLNCRKVAQARISKSWGLGFPSLYFTDDDAKIPLEVHWLKSNKIPDEYFNKPVDVYHLPPVHVQLFNFDDGNSCVLFTFHHILFDFAGVQSFVYSLCGKENIPLIAFENRKRSLRKKFNGFMRAVGFTFKEANYKMTIPERSLPVKNKLQIEFKEISFSVDETASIYTKCKNHGVPLNQSIYFLSAICTSLHQQIFSKQRNHSFIWVPVPVNFRKKGIEPAIFFNGLSFLFYRIPVAVLNDEKSIINHLRKQMMEQMRKDMPNAFIDFVEGYKYMPMPFYYPMMNLPSWGKLSSFSFSVLGKTFTELNEFMGLPVTDVKNYPSNSIFPGFTFLFYEYKGTLKMMSSWVKGQYEEHEQQEVLSNVKIYLLS